MKKNVRFSDMPQCAWLTINRNCNLRCEWCYAQGTKYASEMKEDLAYKIIDIIEQFGIRHVNIIGGEPTCYSSLPLIISYCKSKGIKTGLITNGIKLANNSYLKELIQSGLESVNISIKAPTKEDYCALTQNDCFENVFEAIKNLSSSSIKFIVSYVLSDKTINGYVSVLKKAKELGAKNFYISFCNPFFVNDAISNYGLNQRNIIMEFVNSYGELLEKIKQFSVHINIPFCFFPNGFIDIAKPHIRTICQLQEKKGLIFDENGDLLLCNSLYNYQYGRYNVDYYDFDTLKKYLQSNKIYKIYQTILKAPFKKCSLCSNYKSCGGGCLLRWIKE